MARIDHLLTTGLKTLGAKPADKEPRAAKQRYSQQASEVVALALAEELRERGLDAARPAPPGVLGGSGAERRMAGGLGPKRVDVSWATEEAGLILAVSVKTINFRDNTSGNFQKNLTNRRGDMLFESVTLHRRFPFAVLAGFLILDHEASKDNTATRRSTFDNAHARLQLFADRQDPAGRDEQYERLYIVLFDPNPFKPELTAYAVGDAQMPIDFDTIFFDLIDLVATRNPDFYEAVNGELKRL